MHYNWWSALLNILTVHSVASSQLLTLLDLKGSDKIRVVGEGVRLIEAPESGIFSEGREKKVKIIAS